MFYKFVGGGGGGGVGQLTRDMFRLLTQKWIVHLSKKHDNW